jgi:hypothetical protein
MVISRRSIHERRTSKRGTMSDDQGVRARALNRIADALQMPRNSRALEVADSVRWLVENYKRVTTNLQECVQRHHLGLGGEKVDELVCAELNRLLGSSLPLSPDTPRLEQAMEVPRRIRMDQWTPAEHAIQAAVDAVEVMGADERLTRAVILLADARRAVADFVDGIASPAVVE